MVPFTDYFYYSILIILHLKKKTHNSFHLEYQAVTFLILALIHMKVGVGYAQKMITVINLIITHFSHINIFGYLFQLVICTL